MAEPLRILHLVNGEFYAGAERVQDLLALRLPEHGFTVEFVCLKQGIFAERREAKDAPLTTLAMTSRLDVQVMRALVRHIAGSNVALLHTHTPRAALVGSVAARLTGLPIVHHVHSPAGRDTEQGWRNWRNSVIERFSLGNVRKLIPVSGSLAAGLLAKGFDPELVQLVVNGVPVRPKSRMNYLAGGPLVLGMVALFRPRKGVETLLGALAELRAAGIDVRLRAVGPFETIAYQQGIEALTRQLGLTGHVEWTGFSNDVVAELDRMHLLVLPSLYGEGMPMVLLEAMAAGLPVIASRVEGVPELVRDRQDGILVSPGNVAELVTAIRLFFTGDYNAGLLGDSAWLRQRDHFSDAAMAAGVARIYRDVLQQ